MFVPADTLGRGNEFRLQRDKSDRKGGGLGGVGDGFHLAVFMSQDKASRGQGGTACEEKRELTCLVDV